MEKIKVKRIRPGAKLPARATTGSAGYDLCACIEQPVCVRQGETAKIPTGLAIAIEDEQAVGLVYARSGLATRHGIIPANCVGVIDSDYRGEIFVMLTNLHTEEYLVQPGDRVAQLVIAPVCLPELVECETLEDTERGGKGFGSTGK